MHAAVLQPKRFASAVSQAQYSELRADLEAELRRLLPRGTTGEGERQELRPSSRTRAMEIVGVLRRMDSESFGVCVGCRSPIAYERLAAIPETTVCTRCSRSRELALQG
jgi:RNA polymerase-binding transcription factor DksA